MNKRGKTVDKTYLSIDQAEERGFLHRDYIAHCLRWSHACKLLSKNKRYQSSRILDIGCGRELPMAKMLYSSRLIPQMYYGVDAGPINDEDAAKVGAGKFPHKLWENCNFLELCLDDLEYMDHGLSLRERPNFVTCFEVLEHVEPKMMMDMLEHVKELTSADCTYLFSTPCWNRTDCADNHVNEMLYDALGAAFERHGFVIEHVYGTFASIRDYEHRLGFAEKQGDLVPRALFDKLREYYDTNFLSCVFAPLFPAQSRNCLWVLRRRTTEFECKFPMIQEIQQPWSSSAQWRDMSL